MSTRKSLREIGDEHKSYGEVVREERYFCAVLYHALVSDKPFLKSFLDQCGHTLNESKPPRVYVEYAMARDLWHALGKGDDSNEKKADYIRTCFSPLPDNLRANLDNQSVQDFNDLFVGGGNSSAEFIQSPGRWNKKTIYKTFNNDTNAIKTAYLLRWAFNIKPDIVIEIGDVTAICIEAKMESGLSKYTSPAGTCCQLCVQDFLMKKVLGFQNTRQVILSKNARAKASNQEKGEASKCCDWSEQNDTLTKITWDIVFAASKNPIVVDARNRIYPPKTTTI